MSEPLTITFNFLRMVSVNGSQVNDPIEVSGSNRYVNASFGNINVDAKKIKGDFPYLIESWFEIWGYRRDLDTTPKIVFDFDSSQNLGYSVQVSATENVRKDPKGDKLFTVNLLLKQNKALIYRHAPEI